MSQLDVNLLLGTSNILVPYDVTQGEKAIEIQNQIAKRRIFNFEKSEDLLYHYHNVSVSLFHSEASLYENCMIFTTLRLAKIEGAKIICNYRLQDLADAKHAKLNAVRYDKIVVTDRQGKQGEIGIWSANVCEFFVKCLRLIIKDTNKQMQLPDDYVKSIPLQEQQGWLYKIGGTGLVKNWIKRYFLLRGTDVWYWHDNKAPVESLAEKKIPIKGSVVSSRANTSDLQGLGLTNEMLQNAFSIRPAEGLDKFRILVPNTYDEKIAWLVALKKAGALIEGEEILPEEKEAKKTEGDLEDESEAFEGLLAYGIDSETPTSQGFFRLLPNMFKLRLWKTAQDYYEKKECFLDISLKRVGLRAVWPKRGGEMVTQFVISRQSKDDEAPEDFSKILISTNGKAQYDEWFNRLEKCLAEYKKKKERRKAKKESERKEKEKKSRRIEGCEGRERKGVVTSNLSRIDASKVKPNYSCHNYIIIIIRFSRQILPE